jgi:hypothetical protein
LVLDQPPATTTAAATPQTLDESPQTEPERAPVALADLRSVGFGDRGRVRRRARFLRKARELAYRDLGGLVFNLHRFGQRNDALVIAKLSTISHIDTELRMLETALGERRAVTVLREAGITACPRCAAIHSGEDRFCPNCGFSMDRRVDLPIAGAPPGPTPTPASAAIPTAAPAPVAAQAQPAPAPARTARSTPASKQAAPASDRAPAPTADVAPHPATAPDAATSTPAQDVDQPTEIVRPPGAGA